MPRVTFLRPIDQPLGKQRLLGELIRCLQSSIYNNFRLAVGFVKSGPLYRLTPHFRNWKSAGKTIEAIFGIDHYGTSQQALRFALNEFNTVYVTNVSSSRKSTFHPKLYIFYSDEMAVCFYGSHNLTVGGTETNFEGGVRIDLDRSIQEDEKLFQEMLDCWNSLLPDNCEVTRRLNEQLFIDFLRDNLLLDEATSDKEPGKVSSGIPAQAASKQQGVTFQVKPPSSIPKELLTPTKTKTAKSKKQKQTAKKITVSQFQTITANTFVTQIVPHHNGEVLLSLKAVNQNPSFFGWPFKGFATPKKASNPPYPQRIPDPIVNIEVFDENGEAISSLSKTLFNLNTVYYKPKSEIRITLGKEFYDQVPEYSILVMSKPDASSTYDYDIQIYFPGSTSFSDYLAICNQPLPSGGAKKARKMGWL